MVTKSRLIGVAVFGILTLVALVPAGHATFLAPGTCAGGGCVPPAYTDFGTAGMLGPILADTGVEAFIATSNTGSVQITGNFRSIVLSDGITGGLDFLYQVQRTGGVNSIGRLTTINFATFTTDVGTCTACSELLVPLNADPHKAPQFVARGSGGDDIKFDFGGAASTQIGDSDQSFVLVIKTNATTFSTGSSSIIDGGTTNVASFQPGQPVPEPGTLLLLSSGLIGLGTAARRRLFR